MRPIDPIALLNRLTDVEATEWAEDLRRVGEHESYFFCLNQYLFVAMKEDAHHSHHD